MLKLTALALSIAFLVSSAPAQTPAKFTKMDVTFSTGGDDKDPDTRLELFIADHDGAPAVAYGDVRGQGCPENHTCGPFTVNPTAGGFLLKDYKAEKIIVKITPNGNDTWRFSFVAVLHFTDGTILQLAVPATSLDQGTRTGVYSLAGAVKQTK
jgi:hypothetical protein